MTLLTIMCEVQFDQSRTNYVLEFDIVQLLINYLTFLDKYFRTIVEIFLVFH